MTSRSDLVKKVTEAVLVDCRMSGPSVVQPLLQSYLASARHMLCRKLTVCCLQLIVTYKLNVTRPLESVCTVLMMLLVLPQVSFA